MANSSGNPNQFSLQELANNPEAFANQVFGKDTPAANQLIALAKKMQATQKAIQDRTNGVNSLDDQLARQASQYGFSWKVNNRPAKNHRQAMAKILYDKGVRNLSDLGYSKDGKNLINKTNGQIVSWYKDNTMDKNGRAQIGWNKEGKGRTNYYVQRDGAGNPVVHPVWKSNAPKGIGGFFLKAAAPIAGILGGPLAAAATGAVLGAAQGQKLGQIAKGAAINYVAGNVGNGVANAATKALPMVGTAGITNAIADTAGGLASGATSSALSGQGLKGALPGAVLGGVTSGVGSLAQEASKSLQQAGLPTTAANVATNIVGGGLAPYIASGGNTNAAIAGLTNAAAGSAGQLAGQAVGSVLPPGVVNNIASGVTNAVVAGGTNQLINGTPSARPDLLSQQIASVDPRLLNMARAAVTNNVYMPSTVGTAPVGGLTQANTQANTAGTQANPATGPVEYIPTGYRPPVKSLPTTGLTAVTDPEMLKKLGIG
jgi:hypothetical protein